VGEAVKNHAVRDLRGVWGCAAEERKRPENGVSDYEDGSGITEV
jgi:hypothetical protein